MFPKCNGVYDFLFKIFKSPPASINIITRFIFLYLKAKCIGVFPFLQTKLGLAPHLKRNFIKSKFKLSIAKP